MPLKSFISPGVSTIIRRLMRIYKGAWVFIVDIRVESQRGGPAYLASLKSWPSGRPLVVIKSSEPSQELWASFLHCRRKFVQVLLMTLNLCDASVVGVVQGILGLPSDVFHRLSSVVRPTDAGRGRANVNVSGVSRTKDSDSSSGFRRLSSINLLPGALLAVFHEAIHCKGSVYEGVAQGFPLVSVK